MASTLNVTIDQGTDFHRQITIKDSLGVPIDLTGYTCVAKAKVNYNSPTTSFTFTMTIPTPLSGIIDWDLPHAQTEDINLDDNTEYYYNMDLIDAGGVVQRILEGVITLDPSVYQ